MLIPYKLPEFACRYRLLVSRKRFVLGMVQLLRLRKCCPEMMVSIGNFLFRYRNVLFPMAYVLLFLPGPRLFDDSLLAAWVGGSVAALGQMIRTLTIGLRYIIRGGRRRRVYAEDLVTDGIYALCRNPMYVGNVFIVIGISFAANSLTTVVCAFPLVILAYAAIIAAEERFLLGRFGAAFIDYCAEVPRWVPRTTAIRTAIANSSFHWRRVIIKEYGTPFGWINTLCLVTLFNLWRDDLLADRTEAIQVLTGTMVLTTVLWLIAWIAKKTRLMVAD
ncbi:MAG: methyltransferase family protein [Povalibacter sp.]